MMVFGLVLGLIVFLSFFLMVFKFLGFSLKEKKILFEILRIKVFLFFKK